MNDRFEATNIEDVDEALKHFNHFHDDHGLRGLKLSFKITKP